MALSFYLKVQLKEEIKSFNILHTLYLAASTRAAVVHLNFGAGSTFPFPVFTVPSSMDRTSRCNKVDASDFMLHIG